MISFTLPSLAIPSLHLTCRCQDIEAYEERWVWCACVLYHASRTRYYHSTLRTSLFHCGMKFMVSSKWKLWAHWYWPSPPQQFAHSFTVAEFAYSWHYNDNPSGNMHEVFLVATHMLSSTLNLHPAPASMTAKGSPPRSCHQANIIDTTTA